MGVPKNGLGLTTFLPAIYLQLPHTPSPMPWFQLWPTLRKLTSKQLLIPQSSMIVNLMVSDRFPRSSTYISCLFLPSFLHPCAILSLNNQVTCGPPNQWTRSISPFGLQESRFSNSACSQSISPGVYDLTMRGLLESMVIIPSGIRG